jgi:hypothetical protein
MLSDTDRVCPQYHTDEYVRTLWRLYEVTCTCQECGRHWTIRTAPEPRPVFERSPAEAA